jgi:hypothetical protein
MASLPRSIRQLFGALYAWCVAVFFGAVLLDVVYGDLLNALSASLEQSVFGEVSDFLLILAAFSSLAALAAIGLSIGIRSATYAFASSLLLLSSEFLGPIVFFPLLRSLPLSMIPPIGTFLRLSPVALASFLAFWGLRASFQDPLSLSHV